MTEPLQPETQVTRPHAEDFLILEAACHIDSYHKELLAKTEKEISDFFAQSAALTVVEDKKYTEFSGFLELQYVLAMEEIYQKNAYTTFLISQRLYFRNKKILEQIADARAKSDRAAETSALERLGAKLLKDTETIKKEMADLKLRAQGKEEVKAALIYRGLLASELEISGLAQEIIGISGGTIKSFSAITDLLIGFGKISREVEHIKFLGIFFSVASLAAVLVSSNPKAMSKYSAATLLFGAIAEATGIVAETGELAKILGTTLAWTPIFGFIATGLTMAIAFSNIVKAQLDYEHSVQDLNKYVTTSAGGEEWLNSETQLSDEKEKLKKAILANKVSIKSICSNPIIKSLFTEAQFKSQLMPALIRHAQEERNKKIISNCMTIGTIMFGLAISIAVFAIPGIGQALAIATAVVMISVFVTRLVLNKTALKASDGFTLAADQYFKSVSDLSADSSLALASTSAHQHGSVLTFSSHSPSPSLSPSPTTVGSADPTLSSHDSLDLHSDKYSPGK
ncbi:MAG: hypothetical protein KBD64_00555 [Gammaproteobacteria bacterium]|nr:hypothetical protein [Gammaproteobacteria bacterium]